MRTSERLLRAMPRNKGFRVVSVICAIVGILCIAAACGWFLHNENIQQTAESESKQVAAEIQRQQALATSAQNKQEDDQEETSAIMSTVTINGSDYIGILSISDLDLEIPVMAEWSEANARSAVCRYKGSVATNDMIIAGHNYWSIFGNLHRLKAGSVVVFTDMSNQSRTYELVSTEIIPGSDTARMEAGDWDLTLFTCTNDSSSRVTLRFASK